MAYLEWRTAIGRRPLLQREPIDDRLAAVQLDSVGFRYDRRNPWVLDDVSASVMPGDTIFLGGSNGVGKSTLLQIIVGVLRPSRGAIRERPSIIGWVPERFPAEQPFTVSQYLHGVAGMRGLNQTAATAAVGNWTDRLGITSFLSTRLPNLSKGTAQKVGLAQALLVRPHLLVLDEPWEGLDASSRELVPTIIAEVLADGGAAVVSDHLGQASWLPGAVQWHLTESGFATETPATTESCIVEVSVASTLVPATVALLRAAGHEDIRIRAAQKQ
jgi:ABC-2 type transport system ATP-binding protein